MVQGQHGIGFATVKPAYGTYISPYGPKYRTAFNVRGISPGRAMKFGITAGGFTMVGAFFALQFFADVPKVRKDICSKLPIVGDYFIKSYEIPPSDNPF